MINVSAIRSRTLRRCALVAVYLAFTAALLCMAPFALLSKIITVQASMTRSTARVWRMPGVVPRDGLTR